ncbi:MAG: hypothetical protein JW958_12880 [Candidatus Eisenbacteria bacterium]|nr:hypothetical protein [Candidatus Eisenbacteria bacterium]
MNPSSLLPDPDAIPVPWPWFKILLLITFILHLLFMNLTLGGSLVASWNTLRRRERRPEFRSIPILIALTVNLGVPPLLFAQVLFGHFLYTSSIVMAAWWIAVVPVLLVAYYAAYLYVYKGKGSHRWAVFSSVLSSLLLLAVAFLLVNNLTLSQTPERWTAWFHAPGGTSLNLGDFSLYPRFLHFVLASLAVAGLGSAVWYAVKGRRERSAPATYETEKRAGLRLFSIATMIQVLVGVWFLIALPRPVMLALMGGSAAATTVFLLAVAAALAALFFGFRGSLAPAVGATLLTVILMAILRDQVRGAYLEGLFHPHDLEVIPQYAPLLLFLAVFLLGLGGIGLMVRIAWKATAKAGGSRS